MSHRNSVRLLNNAENSSQHRPPELPEIEDYWEEGVCTPIIPFVEIRRINGEFNRHQR